MKKIIEDSIKNLVSVISSKNITEDETTKLMEVLGTLQGLLIIESLKFPASKSDIPEEFYRSPKAN